MNQTTGDYADRINGLVEGDQLAVPDGHALLGLARLGLLGPTGGALLAVPAGLVLEVGDVPLDDVDQAVAAVGRLLDPAVGDQAPDGGPSP